MFQGSLRFNIDPENKASDDEILYLLEKAGLKHLTNRESSKKADDEKAQMIKDIHAARKDQERSLSLQNKPDTSSGLLSLEIQENGDNLSSGEKSLICICRAILRKNKVVIMDEATANIDLVTE